MLSSLRILAFCGLFVTLFAPTGIAQPNALSSSNLDALFNQAARVEVNLRGAILRLVAEASRNDEPEFASMIDDLRGIYVRQYTLSSARSGAAGQIRELARSFEREGWETLVRVREDDEDVFIYLDTAGDVINGLIVMSLDQSEDEATFVTIDGRIDPAQIGRLGSRFNVPELEDYNDG